jgi:hypothetical protein
VEAAATPLHLWSDDAVWAKAGRRRRAQEVSVAHPGTSAPDQTTVESPGDWPAAQADNAGAQRRRGRIPHVRIPAALRDVALVVLGALLALGADQWREGRERARRAELALEAIRTELETNLRMVEEARAHHTRVRDTLRAYVDRRELPPPRVYLGGIFNPAPVTSTAWDAAREAGALAELPYAVVLHVAPVYETQARYRASADGVAREILTDIMRLGFEPTLRDRAPQFAGLSEDFSNRERVLAKRYREGLAALDSVKLR